MDRFLKFPIDEGIPPVKRLLDKSRLLRDFSNPISCGMKPESLLPQSKRTDRLINFPIDEGISPLKLLSDKDS
uniref:Uncharacterized protein n=1 Tax=Salix viminalis TaxID=40686 RepID=A0A6N2KQE7_SALVM